MKINSNLITSEYNLITDGDAVKTGRKIDGKDEYVKRFSFTISGNDEYSKSLGFTLSDVIITKIEGTELSNSNNWLDVSIGDTQDNNAYAQNLRLMNSDNTIKLNANWNFKNTYVNVYYIYKN